MVVVGIEMTRLVSSTAQIAYGRRLCFDRIRKHRRHFRMDGLIHRSASHRRQYRRIDSHLPNIPSNLSRGGAAVSHTVVDRRQLGRYRIDHHRNSLYHLAPLQALQKGAVPIEKHRIRFRERHFRFSVDIADSLANCFSTDERLDRRKQNQPRSRGNIFLVCDFGRQRIQQEDKTVKRRIRVI